MEALHALVSNNKCIAELLQRGGLLYLLDLFSNGSQPDVREATAALFAKTMTDKLHGPRVGWATAAQAVMLTLGARFGWCCKSSCRRSSWKP